MRVLIITHAAGTPEIGPNTRTYYLATQLARKGVEVHVVGSGVFHKYHKSPLVENKYTTATLQGVYYHWLPTFNYKKRNYQQVLNQIHFVWLLVVKIRHWKKLKPDVVLFSSPPPLASWVAKRIAKGAGAGLIFDIRDLWPEIIMELGNFNSRNPYITLVRWSVNLMYRNADAIVSVKPGDLNYIKQNHRVEGLCEYIPNGLDIANVAEEKYDLPPKIAPLRVVYVGALSTYYALETMLDGVALMDSNAVEVFIVGDGEDRTKLEKKARDLQLNNVQFLGFLPKKYMVSIIEQSDVTFLGLKDTAANRHGISTNKLFEYMYAKKPILASYQSDHDIVAEAKCGLTVAPEDPAAIENALKELLGMTEEKRVELGENGYQYLMEHHTFEQIAEKYLRIIKSSCK